MLEELHAAIRSASEDAIIAVTERDREGVDRAGSMKQTINAMERSIETDLVGDLVSIDALEKRTARAAAPVHERTTT